MGECVDCQQITVLACLLACCACSNNESLRFSHVAFSQAAAERLLHYWEFRKLVFEDRFRLPLDLTGEGALSDDDLQFLQKAPVFLLHDDSYGRAVIYIDRSRMNQSNCERRSLVSKITYRMALDCIATTTSCLNGPHHFFFFRGNARQMRTVFYFLSVAMESPAAREKGIVFVFNAKVSCHGRNGLQRSLLVSRISHLIKQHPALFPLEINAKHD